MSYDVVTLGRISVDIYPDDIGVGLEDVTTFRKYLGGSPSNVAVAAARYGHRTATISRTGNDPFGAFIHDALRGFDRSLSAQHIDTRHLAGLIKRGGLLAPGFLRNVCRARDHGVGVR